jgi:SNF2 family DNA or RNA helicase
MDPITYIPIENPTIVKCCTQVFDFESITMYITTTNSPKCPICRTDITKESLVIVTNDNIDEEETKEDIKYEHIFENNEKDVNLTHILNEKIPQGSRLIIFSEYYETFEHVIKLCTDYNIEYRTVKGNGNVIKNIVEWYNVKSDVTKILFLNARHAGAGLNLQATTDLIIYHKMVAELETQVIGRANRFGREGTLKIWKLLYSTEM